MSNVTPYNIRVINFGPDVYEEVMLSDVADIKQYMGKSLGSWINIEGPNKQSILEAIAPILNIDKATIHDIRNIEMHPRMQPYKSHTFFVSHMFTFDHKDGNHHQLIHEKLSLYFSGEFVLTFHSHNDLELEDIRLAIKEGNQTLCHGGNAYLAYVIIDNLIDEFSPVIDVFSHMLNDIEDQITIKLSSDTILHIHQLKRELLKLRQSLWYINQAVKAIADNPASYISEDLQIRFRNSYEHSLQYLDIIESYREMCSGLQDLFFSSQGNKMNDIMKVLTVIATIFTPLTFITGIYGMNFYEDEPWWNPIMLNQYWGYALSLGIMLVIAVWLTIVYYQKGWLRGEKSYKPKVVHKIKRRKIVK
jgi:magnesium transporter